MTLQEAIIKRIYELIDFKYKTVNEFALDAYIYQSTLRYILIGKTKSVTLLTLKKICDSCDMTLKEFFDTEYFNSLEKEGVI